MGKGWGGLEEKSRGKGARGLERWEGGRAGKGQEGGFSAEENGKAKRQQSEVGEGKGAQKEAKKEQETIKK